MNYEEKYKQALGWMRSLYKGLHGATKEDAEHYFPELKESEDERIRKEIIDALRSREEKTPTEWLEWLEKKGKQTQFDYEHANIPPKDFAPIEPKSLNADEVIAWLEDQACLGWIEDVEVHIFVDKFKKDFGI